MLAASRCYLEHDADITGLSTGQYRYQCDVGMNSIWNMYFRSKSLVLHHHTCNKLWVHTATVNEDSRASVVSHATLPLCTGCTVKRMPWQNSPSPCQYFGQFWMTPLVTSVTTVRAGFYIIRLTVHNTQATSNLAYRYSAIKATQRTTEPPTEGSVMPILNRTA